jgi:nucleoside-diphosphate-sugar epimerase
MNLLVTGASGFVGRFVVSEAAKLGWTVTAVVRSPKEVVPAANYCYAAELQYTDWRPLLRGIDCVIHLAARVHLPGGSSPRALPQFRAVNCEGTNRLAVAAADAGVRRFVFVSSVKVNGEESNKTYSEADTPNPVGPYAQSKLEAEEALARVAAGTDMEHVILRPPLVYGPGVRANFLSLLRAVDSGLPLPLASIENRRSIVYVRSLATALLAASSIPRAAGQTFLVADTEVSTPELLIQIATALGKKPRLFSSHSSLRLFSRMPRLGPMIRRLTGSLTVNSSKIRTELGWSPYGNLQDSLSETAEWFRTSRT